MHLRIRPWVACSISALLGLAALSAHAQKVREETIVENPYRDVGGSCLYGAHGELLHAPAGARCPKQEQPPASAAPTDAHAVSTAPPPEALRKEALALIDERAHLDVEMARLRDAAVYEDREEALRVTHAALAKLELHLAHEARFLERVAAAPQRSQ